MSRRVTEVSLVLYLFAASILLFQWLFWLVTSVPVFHRYQSKPVISKRFLNWALVQNVLSLLWTLDVCLLLPFVDETEKQRNKKHSWLWHTAHVARTGLECALLSTIVARMWLVYFSMRMNRICEDVTWMPLIDARWLVLDDYLVSDDLLLPVYDFNNDAVTLDQVRPHHNGSALSLEMANTGNLAASMKGSSSNNHHHSNSTQKKSIKSDREDGSSSLPVSNQQNSVESLSIRVPFWLRYQQTLGSQAYLSALSVLIVAVVSISMLSVSVMLFDRGSRGGGNGSQTLELTWTVILNTATFVIVGYLWQRMSECRGYDIYDLYRESRGICQCTLIFCMLNVVLSVVRHTSDTHGDSLEWPLLLLLGMVMAWLNISSLLRPLYLIYVQGKVQFGHKYTATVSAERSLSDVSSVFQINSSQKHSGGHASKSSGFSHSTNNKIQRSQTVDFTQSSQLHNKSLTPISCTVAVHPPSSPVPSTPSVKKKPRRHHSMASTLSTLPRISVNPARSSTVSGVGTPNISSIRRSNTTPIPSPRRQRASTTTSNDSSVTHRLSVATAFHSGVEDSGTPGAAASSAAAGWLSKYENDSWSDDSDLGKPIPSAIHACVFVAFDRQCLPLYQNLHDCCHSNTPALNQKITEVRSRGLKFVLSSVAGVGALMQYLSNELCKETLMAYIEFDQFERRFSEENNHNNSDDGNNNHNISNVNGSNHLSIDSDDTRTEMEMTSVMSNTFGNGAVLSHTPTSTTTMGEILGSGGGNIALTPREFGKSNSARQHHGIGGAGRGGGSSSPFNIPSFRTNRVNLPRPIDGVFPKSTAVYGHGLTHLPSMEEAFSALVSKYIAPGAKFEVNVSYGTRKTLMHIHTVIQKRQQPLVVQFKDGCHTPLSSENVPMTALSANDGSGSGNGSGGSTPVVGLVPSVLPPIHAAPVMTTENHSADFMLGRRLPKQPSLLASTVDRNRLGSSKPGIHTAAASCSSFFQSSLIGPNGNLDIGTEPPMLTPFVFGSVSRELRILLKHNFDEWSNTLQFMVFAKSLRF